METVQHPIPTAPSLAITPSLSVSMSLKWDHTVLVFCDLFISLILRHTTEFPSCLCFLSQVSWKHGLLSSLEHCK
jgi:hypothetical protein